MEFYQMQAEGRKYVQAAEISVKPDTGNKMNFGAPDQVS